MITIIFKIECTLKLIIIDFNIHFTLDLPLATSAASIAMAAGAIFIGFFIICTELASNSLLYVLCHASGAAHLKDVSCLILILQGFVDCYGL